MVRDTEMYSQEMEALCSCTQYVYTTIVLSSAESSTLEWSVVDELHSKHRNPNKGPTIAREKGNITAQSNSN